MAFSATPKFPGAVAAVGDLLNQANRLASSTQPTLSAAITSTATSATLATGTGAIMPTDNFCVTLDSEILLITSRTGDTLTIGTRGYQGTTAAAHNAAANVDAFITAVHHNQLAAEVNAIETQLGASLANVVLTTAKNAANGVATLDATSRLTTSQIPTTVVLNSQGNTFVAGTKQVFAASAATGAGINLGNTGAVPTAPVVADFVLDAATYLLKWYVTPAAPAAPTLGSSAGGALAATTYFVKVTGVINGIESAASAEHSLAVAVNNVLTVTSPASGAFDHYNVYVSTATGTETKQNASPIAIGVSWTEPTSGLISGVAAPTTGSGWMSTVNPANAGGGSGGAVSSVFGRTGIVTAQTGDYTAAQVTGAEATANKNANSGYAGLDASAKMLPAQLPSVAVRTDVSPSMGAGTKLTVAASAAGGAGLNIPLGVTPTTPVAGDVYIDSSSFVLKYFANGAWQSTSGSGGGGVTSVYGRTGAVVATTGDYTAAQVTNAESTANKGAASGYAALDSSQHLVETNVGVFLKNANFTPVAVSTSTTATQNLMSFALPAGYMDVLTRGLRVKVGGFYSTSASACNMTLAVVLQNVNGLGQIVFSVPASASDNAWDAEYIITRNSTGTSGVLTSIGTFVVQAASAPASSVVGHREWINDMTVAQTLLTQVTFSVASASNVCRQYYMIVERLNY